MRLVQSIGLGLAAAANTINDELVTAVGGTRICGYLTGDTVRLADSVELETNEGCIWKWVPEHDGIIRITLEDSQPSCDDGNMYIITNGAIHGPFCETTEDRHRRDDEGKTHVFKKEYSYTADEITGKDVDVVYTNDGGFRFRFNFNFEFELMPGKPGAAAQSGFHNAVYGSENKKPDPYKPDPYKPTTQAPYNPPEPTYTTPDPYATTKKPKPYKPKPDPYKPDPVPPSNYPPSDPYIPKPALKIR